MITILAGGTGSIKIIRGLASCNSNLSIISNIGDNFWFNGLYVCPDIDTCIYGLAGILDKNRGWGIKNDTFYYLNVLKVLGEESWFQIGDKDLVTHIIRTKMLSKGFSLSQIVRWIAFHQYNIQKSIIPASNVHIETRIVTNQGDMNIQEFWVKNKAKPKVLDIYYKNSEQVKCNKDALRILRSSDVIILAPANPVSSIGPILSLTQIKKELIKQRDKVIAISPIIGKKAISGPAGKYLKAKGIESSCHGIAKFYSQFISKMVIDHTDANFSNEIVKMGISTFETNILMNNAKEEKRLAKFILKVMNCC
ncbi:MAG TPA: 2-phospho-L-lactate transferase [Nitrososphaeraceae archaeon]|nr:2-phospho-L-lactate transferase [Nitrososphaeraceae archaeon]